MIKKWRDVVKDMIIKSRHARKQKNILLGRNEKEVDDKCGHKILFCCIKCCACEGCSCNVDLQFSNTLT